MGTIAIAMLAVVQARACARGTASGVPRGAPARAIPASAAALPGSAAAQPAERTSPESPAVKPDSGAEGAATVPTRTLPCVDDHTVLVADSGRALLCWGQRCVAELDDPASTVGRPAPSSAPPEAVVSADRVCSGAQCDRLGPRLRTAVADAGDGQLSATRDHQVVVVHHEPASFTVWSRAADRPVDLGEPAAGEGEVVGVDAIGDWLIVARSCHERCGSVAQIVDANGRRLGRGFAATPHWGRADPHLVALGDDNFVVLGQFGEITLIARNRVIASASLLPEHARPLEVVTEIVRVGERTLVAVWCAGTAPDRSCHVTRIAVDVTAAGERRAIVLYSDRPLPLCSPARAE